MPTILGNGYGGWAQIYDIKKLSNGNLAVFWNEPSESTSLNMQIIDESGNTLLREPTAFGGKAFSDIYLFNASVEIFSNGNLAVFWREYNADSGLYHLNMQIADQAGNLISDSPIAISGVSDYSQIADIVSISNGSLAVFFAEYSGSDWEPYVKAQVITPDGNVSFASPTTLGKGLDFFMNMGKINFKSTTLTNGDIAICWYNVVDTSLEVRVFDPTSSTFFTPSSSLTGGDFTSMPVNNLNIAALQDGNFAVFYGTTIYWSDVGLNTQIFDSECNFESITTLKNPLFITSYNNLAIDILPNQYLYTEPDIFKDDLESNYRIFEDISNPDKYYSYKGLSDIFGGLFANKSLFAQGSSVSIDRAALARMVTDSLNEAALSVPISDISRQEMSLAMALASILKDPTDDQKLVLDIVETLLNDMKELKTEKAQNPDLDKTENELMMVVTSYLLAQGIPDLLKEGDISNIRNIFKDFGQSRDKIMLDYRESIKPYYNRMIKELESNLAILQLKGILSKKLTQEELHKFEPKEIDRLTSAIRKANDRSFEMEYILQQEGKYRKEYIDPSNKVLAEAMKKLMKSFAWKLNNALETQKK
jgi:hypothetical protein